VVDDRIPTITYYNGTIRPYENLYPLYNLNLYLILCIGEKALTYVLARWGEVRQQHVHCVSEARGSSSGKLNVCIIKEL
jgi:hypothetical protein